MRNFSIFILTCTHKKRRPKPNTPRYSPVVYMCTRLHTQMSKMETFCMYVYTFLITFPLYNNVPVSMIQELQCDNFTFIAQNLIDTCAILWLIISLYNCEALRGFMPSCLVLNKTCNTCACTCTACNCMYMYTHVYIQCRTKELNDGQHEFVLQQ